jgi:hypothetical protein
MKSAKQILDYILNNQENYENCIDEIETQLQLARLQGIRTFDTELAGRIERQFDNELNNSTGTVLHPESKDIFDCT